MKTALLFSCGWLLNSTCGLLGGLGLAASAQAQTPWLLRNPLVSSQTPPSFVARHTRVVGPGVAWQLLAPAGTNDVYSLMRTANGTNWEYETINGASGYTASSIAPLSATTACVTQYGFGANGGGEILRTTNGGRTWSKVSTNSQFNRPNGFAAWAHFFSATEGVAAGDPNTTTWEVLRSTNAGLTWTAVPASNLPPPLDAQEYTYPHSFCTLGSTIWMGTQHGSSAAPRSTRVLKSTDRGQTWTASSLTPLTGYIDGLAFSSPLVGIAHRGTALIRTTDGGTTWQFVNPASNPQAGGRFYGGSVAAVPGTNALVSVGSAVQSGSRNLLDYGSSVSTDGGLTWQDLDQAQGFYQTVHFAGAQTAFIGGITDGGDGSGGAYQAASNVLAGVVGLLAARPAAPVPALRVSPNPVADGYCTLHLNAPPAAGAATITLLNPLGQAVRHLPARRLSLPESRFELATAGLPTGLYLVRVGFDNGSAPLTQRLLIQ